MTFLTYNCPTGLDILTMERNEKEEKQDVVRENVALQSPAGFIRLPCKQWKQRCSILDRYWWMQAPIIEEELKMVC